MEYTAALHAYRESVRELDAVTPSPQFPEAYQRAVSAHLAFEEARDALARHAREHSGRRLGTEFKLE